MRGTGGMDLNVIKDVYDQLLQKEKEHQAVCIGYDEKINKMQDDLYNRIHKEKERSTQLTAVFMAHHQKLIEGMYALMTRMQKAVMSDRDCVPLSQLQSQLFTLGNDQLEAFNTFSVMTTNNKKTNEHVRRKALAKKLDEQCAEIRKTISELEHSLSTNSTIDTPLRLSVLESAAKIELAIQSFLKVFAKLRAVLNRGEDMHDKHVDSIIEYFDRMQQEIVGMPPLGRASALEVIENGLAQLGIADSQGQQAIANESTTMIGWIGSWFG
ncbi:hypothetical protein PFISCL1PPCAC_24926 [Pristionchus fissidentatus]|uniref:Uncharacterized protein n=1 Tax=Pristionchus fissidentatus TaxID=1538716 RepID=A0AAV5WSF1_9BILA|nr:hypothetical protein PFISCL1PPCAC_24926 [Pristionchus fissidentatus]